MVRAKLPLFCLLLALAISLFPDACIARLGSKNCGSSFCGNVNISNPFRLKTQPHRCGFKWYDLVCDNNRTVFPMKHGNFYVQDISYVNETIHLLDVSLDNDNCSIPYSSFRPYSYSTLPEGLYRYTANQLSVMYLVNCTTKINSSVYIDASRCRANRSHSPTPPTNYFYFLAEQTAKSDFHQSCTVEAQVPIMLSRIKGLSTSDIYETLMMGLQFSWSPNSYSPYDWLRWNSVANALLSLLRLLLNDVDIYIRSNLAFFLRGTSMQGYFVDKGSRIFSLAITGHSSTQRESPLQANPRFANKCAA